jgi:hypothetical protein
MIKNFVSGRIGRLQFAILLLLPIPLFIAHPFFNQGDSIFFYYWFPYAMFLANKRLHDFGISMLSKQATQYANFKILFFKTGDNQVNVYGKPPRF